MLPVNILFIGDPHFKIGNLKDTDPMAEAIIAHARQGNKYGKYDIIVPMGDLLDSHEKIHVSPLSRATKFIIALKEIAPTYVLIGNHDLKNNREFCSDEHPFLSLKYLNDNSLTIVDTTIIRNINGHTFTFFPYVPNERVYEALELCPSWKESTGVIGHIEIKGCKMGSIISVSGAEWPLTHPYLISGHIHDYQEPQTNVLYVGTPIQHGYGDTHDKSISSITFLSPTERIHERIDLGLRKKKIVKIVTQDITTYIPPKNWELKITISGNDGEIKAAKKHPNIDLWKKLGHKISFDTITPESEKIALNVDPLITKTPQKFSSLFYGSIEHQPRLTKLYTTIFGKLGKLDKSNNTFPASLKLKFL